MRKNATARLYVSVLFVVGALAGTASPARAQFIRRSVGGAAAGEKYHIEASTGIWSPGTQMAISSEALGIPGDAIDFKTDLGLTDQRFKEVHFVLHPARKHKFRYQYIPIKFEQGATITRDIVFRGQRFRIGVPVKSGIDWRAHRFSYEYDFVSLNRGFGGFILDAKYTDVRAFLESPQVRRESIHAAAPIPAAGGIFRVSPIQKLSMTGEITGFRLPEGLIEDAKAHYLDLDFYGTFNITNNIGAQIGYRRLDLGLTVSDDIGDFELKGFYFGLVARY